MHDIDISRFLNPVPEEFFCPICTSVLDYPHILEDYIGHCFCKKCIAEWLNYQKTCPIDRTHLEEKNLKPVGVLIKSMIGKLQICCKFKKNGCAAVCAWEFLERHESECQFFRKICEYCQLSLTSDESKAHNCVTSKLTISVDAIAEKIKTIGTRKIYYSKDLKPDSSSPINAFAINSDGYVVVGCIDNKTRILLYNPNGQLKKKADFDFYISAIGISDDRIFSAYYQTTDDQNKHEQLRIIAYDFELIKTNSFTNNISYAVYVFYNHIDFCNNRVYLKVGTKLMGTRQSCQKVYVLDNKLNKIEQFTIDEPAELCDIKIRSDYITYYSVSMNTYTFHIKSLKTKKLLNKLDLKIDSFEHISFDTVSNGNVYVLIAKDSLLYEYDLFGKLIQSIKVRSGKSASNTLRMSENFNVAILSTDDKVLYLN